MSEVDAHGNTKRDNLLSAQRQLKRVPKELEDLVELPDCMREYWFWFIRLSNRRPSGMGISAIPYSEMLAFFELMGIVPDPVEIEVIEAFDKIAMQHYQKQQAKEQAKAKQKSTGKKQNSPARGVLHLKFPRDSK